MALSFIDNGEELINMMRNELTDHPGFRTWLFQLPADSLHRLRLINRATSSSHHVLMAIAFGLYDKHIFKLNRIITTMLVARMKAERAGKVRLVASINKFMDELHVSVDLATNVQRENTADSAQACQRPIRMARKSLMPTGSM